MGTGCGAVGRAVASVTNEDLDSNPVNTRAVVMTQLAK